MRRGDVVIVSLHGELGKPRPAVIVQTDLLTPLLASVLLFPMTSFSSNPALFRVAVDPTAENGPRVKCEVMVDKVQSSQKVKVGKVVGRLSDEDMLRVSRSLLIVFGLSASPR